MGEAVTTNGFRKRLARHFFNGQSLPPITQMAFGDGGHKDDRTPQSPDPDQVALNHECLRKDLINLVQEDDYSVTGTGRIAKSELIGINLSEAGLLDEAGSLMAFKNFSPKIKDGDEEYDFTIKLKF